MIDFLKTHSVTLVIAISGFVVTYLLTTKNLKDEISKNKKSVMIDSIKELPYDICMLMDNILKNENKNKNKLATSSEKFQSIMYKVLAYGSKDAVNIAVFILQLSYSDNTAIAKALSGYSLLITQLKYDITGEIISPISWLKMKTTDYNTLEDSVKYEANEIITNLKLNSKFKI